jgi:hypothetical protein
VRIHLLATAATAVALSGCSSGPPEYRPPPGALVAGTAQVSLDGQDAGTTDAVQCMVIGPLTIIRTGDQDSGVMAMVSNKDQLTAQLVDIRDLGGFTGSYNEGLGGEADVSMTGPTYQITGTTISPGIRPAGKFAIKVSC